MAFTTAKLRRRVLPLNVRTRAFTQRKAGQGTGQGQVTLVCIHCLGPVLITADLPCIGIIAVVQKRSRVGVNS